MSDRRIIALIPAHNEAGQIDATVASLLAQTVPPAQIVVLADNCTDDTVGVALRAGAIGHITVDNSARKAGALNQGIALVLPLLADSDLLLMADADSVLAPDWIENAVAHLDVAERGAISGSMLCRKGAGMLGLVQQAEYAFGARKVARAKGAVWVLSGAAVAMRVDVARRLVEARGYVYDETSLTEDYELTLALRGLGYDPRGFKNLRVVTDVMTSWRALWDQRLRWQRGTIETLLAYGWTSLTRKAWITVVSSYGGTLLLPIAAAVWAYTLSTGVPIDGRWLLTIPVFSIEQFVTARRAGPRAALMAAALLPGVAFTTFRHVVYWAALWRIMRRSTAAWA